MKPSRDGSVIVGDEQETKTCKCGVCGGDVPDNGRHKGCRLHARAPQIMNALKNLLYQVEARFQYDDYLVMTEGEKAAIRVARAEIKKQK